MQKNEAILTMLDEWHRIWKILGDQYREKAYKQAISLVKSIDYELTVDNIPQRLITGIGDHIRSHIDATLRGVHCKELENIRKSKKYKAFVVLSGVMGLGPKTIDMLIKRNIYDLAALRKAVSKKLVTLTHIQKLGLRWYIDLATKIPRAEVGQLSDMLISLFTANVQAEVVGSYRRKLPLCKDIDILLSSTVSTLSDIYAQLQKMPWYVDTIVFGDERFSFLMLSPISDIVRQVDLLFVAKESWPFALCYFTGSAAHNEMLRGRAKKLGMRLNQHELCNIKTGRLLELTTEHDIYLALNLRFYSPEERL